PTHPGEAAQNRWLAGNGPFTKKCHRFFEQELGFPKVLLTSSCTDALEMASLLLNIGPEDEVILPSFTFVSTANAFALRGASLVFADCHALVPNISAESIRQSITPKTKAIVLVHYAGIACEMDEIMEMAESHGIFVIEDAALAMDSFYKGKRLGTFGHLATFSFHETKNIIAGEGGMLVINDEQFLARAEILWEKGTNRAAFYRGETDKYRWMDLGSSFLPSDMIGAFLYAQLESLEYIQALRKEKWRLYAEQLKGLAEEGLIQLPSFPVGSTNNASMFYLLVNSPEERNFLLDNLRKQHINAVFHYLPLHQSPFFKEKYNGPALPHTMRFSETLIRLPFFAELTPEQQIMVTSTLKSLLQGVSS
ncbi:MAG: dTDP-4-amino-4,6-dideoxygalactose transaminase, partial [Bacteroidota bacterium]